MTPEKVKEMINACYLAKRVRDMLPTLSEGVLPSYIQFLDAIQKLEARGDCVKVSDISDALGLPRPGVTKTVKEMQAKGYLDKAASREDGRITFVSVTEKGRQLSEEFDKQYFARLAGCMDGISESDADTMIRTISRFYQIMSERKMDIA